MKASRRRKQQLLGPHAGIDSRKQNMRQAIFSIRNKEKNRSSRIQYANGTVYVGELQENQPHGFGTKEYPNNSRYEGEWKFGRRHGYGTYNYTEKNQTYKGEWSNNRRDGTGTLVTFNLGNELKLVGRWRDDKVNGKATITYVDGTKIRGEWQNGTLIRILENTSPQGKALGCVHPTDDAMDFPTADLETIKEILELVTVNECHNPAD